MNTFVPEGVGILTPENQKYTASARALQEAMHAGRILEAKAVRCDREHNLYVQFPGIAGVIPREECALGIRIMEPGYRKVCILPMDCGLKHIKGSIPTPYGDLKVEHFWKDGAVKTSVRVPEGIEILCDSNAK